MKIVVLSDLHYGHRKVSGKHLHFNLIHYAYPEIEKCDLLILSGDTFHQLLDFNNPAASSIIQFFNDLFYMSLKYNFKIRILRGTYSHDRDQVKYIEKSSYKYMNEQKVDLKTYSEISIDEETVGSETIRLLYLPDDLPYKNQNECMDAIYKLMESRKWDKVDMIVAHGYCQYVLPANSRGPAVVYTAESLSSICKHVAVFGHVHTPSTKQFDNLLIVYVGSFERMNHGEEERKGFITIDTKNWTVEFKENKNTLKFMTYEPTIEGTEAIVDDFKRWLFRVNLSDKNVNYIRVKHNDTSLRQLLGRILREEYKAFKIVYTSESAKEKTTLVENALVIKDDDNLVKPTEDNIVQLILDNIKERNLPVLSRSKVEQLWNLNFGELHG